MSDNTDNTDNSEISSITDAYGEPIEYDGNPAHAAGYIAAIVREHTHVREVVCGKCSMARSLGMI